MITKPDHGPAILALDGVKCILAILKYSSRTAHRSRVFVWVAVWVFPELEVS